MIYISALVMSLGIILSAQAVSWTPQFGGPFAPKPTSNTHKSIATGPVGPSSNSGGHVAAPADNAVWLALNDIVKNFANQD